MSLSDRNGQGVDSPRLPDTRKRGPSNGQHSNGGNGSSGSGGSNGAVQTLRRRAQFLLQQDKALIDMVLSGRMTRREIGQLLGIPAGTVSRRVWRLSNRLRDPLVVALLERGEVLRTEVRQLGIEYFLQGQSIGQLADLHQMSRNEVHRIIAFIRGWFDATGEVN